MRWLWRALTYRVGVRLFISYLLVGLTPIALAACLALVVGYALVGQYAATRVRGEMDGLGSSLAGVARAVVAELAAGRPEVARETAERGGKALPDGMRLEWALDAPSGQSRQPGRRVPAGPTMGHRGGVAGAWSSTAGRLTSPRWHGRAARSPPYCCPSTSPTPARSGAAGGTRSGS